MFSWSQDELIQEQSNAILSDQNVLLVACPGSGKTRTLTYKIALELSKLDSEKKFIIAITYTNNAADEIRDRIELLGVDTQQLWIGTIHAFCLEWILRPYHQYLPDLKYGFSVINSYESEKILTDLCSTYTSEKLKITYWDCGYIATTSGDKLMCSNTRKHDVLNKIYEDYFNILEKSKQIDFEQILKFSYKLLEQEPKILMILNKLFSYILVDEYQDTKDIQYHILALIIKSDPKQTKIFIVGDPNQAIYGGLGGICKSKRELDILFNINFQELSLTMNFRSSSRIVNYFENYKISPNTICAAGIHRDYPSLITYNKSVKLDNLLDEVERLILFNINEKKILPTEICIAAPQWVCVSALTRKLIAKMPDYSFNGPGIAPFSRDIENFWYKLTKIFLTEPSPDMYLKRLRWSKEILEQLNLHGMYIVDLTPKQLLKVCNSLDIVETRGISFLERSFKQFCLRLGLNISVFPILLEQQEAFIKSAYNRLDKLRNEGITDADTTYNFKKIFRQKDGITVSTIHGIKGEEYDVVIAIALLNDYVPHFADHDSLKEENAKKILYVLSSRARKNLHLISERMRSPNCKYAPNGKSPTPQLENYAFEYDEF